MLLGITLSNLSGDQKNLKAQIFFFNQVCRGPGHQHSAKETLPRDTQAHLATFLLCRVPAGGTRQKVDAVNPPDGQRTADARAGHMLGLCRVPPTSTRQRSHVAECLDLPRACIRQRPSMPCARFLLSVRGLALKPPLYRVPVVCHSAKT